MHHLRESDLTLGEDVIVINHDKPNFDQIGQIWKINTHTTPIRVSVSFDGNVFNYDVSDLALA